MNTADVSVIVSFPIKRFITKFTFEKNFLVSMEGKVSDKILPVFYSFPAHMTLHDDYRIHDLVVTLYEVTQNFTLTDHG